MGNYVTPILNLKICSDIGSVCEFEGTGELHNEELPMSDSNATEMSNRKSFFISHENRSYHYLHVFLIQK